MPGDIVRVNSDDIAPAAAAARMVRDMSDEIDYALRRIIRSNVLFCLLTSVMVFPMTKTNDICVKLNEIPITKAQHCR